MQKKPEGGQYRMGYGSAKEMDDDFTSRSAWGDKRTKSKSNEPEAELD
jgi:hypothetical protein